MKTLTKIAIDSIAMSTLNARAYVNLRNDVADNRAVLLAKLNEAEGKAIMAFQLLHEMGKVDEASAVLAYFNDEVAHDFQKMLEANK